MVNFCLTLARISWDLISLNVLLGIKALGRISMEALTRSKGRNDGLTSQMRRMGRTVYLPTFHRESVWYPP